MLTCNDLTPVSTVNPGRDINRDGDESDDPGDLNDDEGDDDNEDDDDDEEDSDELKDDAGSDVEEHVAGDDNPDDVDSKTPDSVLGRGFLIITTTLRFFSGTVSPADMSCWCDKMNSIPPLLLLSFSSPLLLFHSLRYLYVSFSCSLSLSLAVSSRVRNSIYRHDSSERA